MSNAARIAVRRGTAGNPTLLRAFIAILAIKLRVLSAKIAHSVGSAYELSGVMSHDFDDRQTYAIIGAAMAVHRELGCGFLEAVSREAFTIELPERRIPFVREVRLPVRYKNRVLPVSYIVDFICYDEVLVELKALSAIGITRGYPHRPVHPAYRGNVACRR